MSVLFLTQRLPEGVSVLLGRLKLRQGANGPYVMIDVPCDYCRRTHTHGWPANETSPMGALYHKSPHCDEGSPYRPGGYFVGLDPRDSGHNQRVLRRYELAMWKGTRRAARRRS